MIQTQLENFYRARLGNADITACQSITDGWETEVYSFILQFNDRSETRILRLYPGINAAAKAAHEFSTLQKLDAQGYPVPQVFELETDDQWLGKPFITMKKIEGQPAAALVTAENQVQMLDLFCGLLIRLHQLDIQPFVPSDVSASDLADPLWFARRIAAYLDYVLTGDLAIYFAPLCGWLKANVVPSPRYALLHSDFHGSNILVTPDSKPFVIDWGTSLIGDDRFDLAWTLLLSSTYGQPQYRDTILQRYGELRGEPVDQIEYFEVLAAVRRLSDLAVSLTKGAEHQGMRPETAAIMRRNVTHYETVYQGVKARTGLQLPALESLLTSLR